MMVAWVGSFLAVSAFTYFVVWPVGTSYRLVVTVAVFAGVMDILIFAWVREPAHETVRDTSVWRIVLEPLRDAGYRRFVLFWVAWTASRRKMTEAPDRSPAAPYDTWRGLHPNAAKDFKHKSDSTMYACFKRDFRIHSKSSRTVIWNLMR